MVVKLSFLVTLYLVAPAGVTGICTTGSGLVCTTGGGFVSTGGRLVGSITGVTGGGSGGCAGCSRLQPWASNATRMAAAGTPTTHKKAVLTRERSLFFCSSREPCGRNGFGFELFMFLALVASFH